MHRRVRLALASKLLLLALLLANSYCTPPTFVVQQYAGPARAAETIAILRVDGSGNVQLLSLDGEAADARVTPDARLHVELLPGVHTVWVQSLSQGGQARSLSFRAEANKVYRVEFVVSAGDGSTQPRAFEVDRDSNALKSDVTLAPPTPHEPPKPRTPTPPARILQEAAPASTPSDSSAPAPGDTPLVPDAGAPPPTP
jgi:hypothetical protein